MSKKSGLADSPFFNNVSPEAKAPAADGKSPTQTQKPLEPVPVLPAHETQFETKAVAKKSIQKSKHASMKASKQESLHENKQTNMQARKHESLQAIMQAYLSEKVDDIATFRYPVDLLEKLEDVIHQVRKKHHRKLTKQAVAVAALAFLLTDFEAYGEESMLYQLLIKQDD